MWATVGLPPVAIAHWYVNFQLPMERTEDGYDTLDLVLDLIVAPDWSWSWKDVEPFEAAVRRGIFTTEMKAAVETQAADVHQSIADQAGPFAPAGREWTAPTTWPDPSLPAGFADRFATPPGATITLSPDPIV